MSKIESDGHQEKILSTGETVLERGLPRKQIAARKRKSDRIHVRATSELKKALEKEAAEFDLKLSDFLRALIENRQDFVTKLRAGKIRIKTR